MVARLGPGWLVLAALFTASDGFANDAVRPPNVILILADDMAVGDLGCLNGGRSRTPHLDRLKQQSVWFSQAYSASPVCAPARAALLTGRYPHRTGVVSLNMEQHPTLTRLHRSETTLANLFRSGGYATGLIGKWHCGAGRAYHPLNRGFDEFAGFVGHLYVPSYFNFQLDIQHQTERFSDRYLTIELSRRAVDFVRRHHEHPFFLHLAHYTPHRPLGAPEERIQPYLDAGLSRDVATVYAMIEIMDEGLGQLFDELDRLALRDNTIILFASDNGPDSLVDQRFNVELRGTKYMVYEGGIRVPLMVRWPGRFTPAERDAPIHFTDVLPTLVELCQLQPPAGVQLDGASFASLLAGQPGQLPARRFWQWNRETPLYSHNAAVREGNWKLVRPFVTQNVPRGQSDLPPVLYNLATDPGETRDLAARHVDRAARLNALLEAWAADVERERTSSN